MLPKGIFSRMLPAMLFTLAFLAGCDQLTGTPVVVTVVVTATNTPAPAASPVAAATQLRSPATTSPPQASASPAPTSVTAQGATPGPAASPIASQPARTVVASPATVTPSAATPAPALNPSATRPAGTATPPPSPTPQAPVSPNDPSVKYEIADERTIGRYTLRMWHNPGTAFDFENVATISTAGQPQLEIPATAFGLLTGKDLTGEGNPDVVIETYSGGAHCCFGTYLFDLGSQPEMLLDAQTGNCGGQFQDLNGDGVYEFTTCDDSFAYTYCPYVASPKVMVVLALDKEKGYIPANPKYAGQYAESIGESRTRATRGAAGESGEWDNTNKCSVLPLVLNLLYSGQPDQAWQGYDQYYTGPDKDRWRVEIQDVVEASRWYVPR